MWKHIYRKHRSLVIISPKLMIGVRQVNTTDRLRMITSIWCCSTTVPLLQLRYAIWMVPFISSFSCGVNITRNRTVPCLGSSMHYTSKQA